MIRIKPGKSKTLTFTLSYEGLNLTNAVSRVLIPISENLLIQAPGSVIDMNKIIVKVPPLQEFFDVFEKSKASLEVITADGQYFKPYETDIIFEKRPTISSVSLKEEESEEEEKQPEVKVEDVEEQEVVTEPGYQSGVPNKEKEEKEEKEEKKKKKKRPAENKLREFLSR